MNRQSWKAGLRSKLVGLAAAGLVCGTAAAHHSFAMYDLSKHETFTGQLTRFVVGANHSQLIFNLIGDDGMLKRGADGKPIIWGVETTSAQQLARRGITVKSFKVGTILTVTLHPLRDGRNFGALRYEDGILISCGLSMPKGGCNEQTGKIFVGKGAQDSNAGGR
ncbi:MAG TPA: DUF6152 family protein [Gammaproteobacteria bacterium]|nr:DUF6152 family protein [Gammaproteobacteria bacterium]